MVVETLQTPQLNIRLIKPNVERDSNLGLQWLKGDAGHNTLKLMGVPDKYNQPSTLDKEKQRVHEFMTKVDQLNWMIEYKGTVVGIVWVDLEKSKHTPNLSVSIMIADPNVRGKGIGQASLGVVIKYLRQKGTIHLYSRHLIENIQSKRLLEKLGFINFGEPYIDEDGLEWQNLKRTLN